MRKYAVNVDKMLELHNKNVKQQQKYILLINDSIKALEKHDGKVLNSSIKNKLPDNLRYYHNEYSHTIHHANAYNEYTLYFNKIKGEKVRINIKELKEKLAAEKEKLKKIMLSGEKIVEKVQIFNISLQYYKKAYDELTKIEGFYEYSDYI